MLRAILGATPRATLLAILMLCSVAWSFAAHAQDGEDYMTDEEESNMRDTQEADKRMILLLDFGQRRIDAVKREMGSNKPDAGRNIQKTLSEYVHIMEDLQDSIDDARDHRVPMSKGLKDIETRGNLYLNFFKSINSEALPAWKDYHYTLDEAMAMTQDEIADVRKGAFPETKGRTPPNELPAKAPPVQHPPADAKEADKPAAQPGDEGGPPRKSHPQQ
jgi:hypothetical protein